MNACWGRKQPQHPGIRQRSQAQEPLGAEWWPQEMVTEQQLCHQGEEESWPFPGLAPHTLEQLEYIVTARVKR